jgi:ABC-type sugar transport system permease subunit
MAQPRQTLTARNTLVGYSFILPNFIGFFFFVLIPVLFSLVISFTNWDGYSPMKFTGLRNFIRIFRESDFTGSIGRTFVYALACVVFTMFASLGLAVLLNREIKAKGFFRSAIYFPSVAAVISIAVVWKLLFMNKSVYTGDPGPVNAFLNFIGIANPPDWFNSSKWAMPAIIIVSVWKSMGYYMIVYLAALQNIPKELKEAASIDGATGLQYFWRIALPTLLPATFFVVLMLTIGSFKSFDLIFALAEDNPGAKVISLYIYNNAFKFFDYGKTSAAAFVLFAIIGAITAFQFRMEKKLSA